MKIIYSTFSSIEEAKKAAKILVSEKYAACCNFFTGSAMFEWEGEMHDKTEVMVFIKVADRNLEHAMNKLKEIHEYETPCVFVLEPKEVNEDFAKWVNQCSE